MKNLPCPGSEGKGALSPFGLRQEVVTDNVEVESLSVNLVIGGCDLERPAGAKTETVISEENGSSAVR